MLAGAPDYAYNEYLQIWIELGLPGVLSCLCLMAYVYIRLLRCRNVEVVGLCGAMVSFMVVSFFSYPLRYFATCLLSLPEKNKEMYRLAEEIKQAFYGNRIVMFAPLYLSNYCVNGCVYCPYHMKNKHISRIKLSQEDIKREVIALQDMGHKRLAIEAGEDPVNNPIEYILDSIKTIYSVHHKNGDIRRVNVNIAATTVENYRKLKDAGIGTYILFQETYNKKSYLELHPTGPKHDYNYHTEAMDRAMEGGIDDVGLGVLFGLEGYQYEFAGLLMHAEHLEAVHGVGPHTISVPRVKKADDIDPDEFDNGLEDEIFEKIAACIRIAVPYTQTSSPCCWV